MASPSTESNRGWPILLLGVEGHITDRELWACANEVLRQHGSGAPVFVAERIGDLALRGDVAGVATWKAIASRMDQLIPPDGSTQ